MAELWTLLLRDIDCTETTIVELRAQLCATLQQAGFHADTVTVRSSTFTYEFQKPAPPPFQKARPPGLAIMAAGAVEHMRGARPDA